MKQPCHADDGIHWRSDLMAHGGEERVFGRIGIFGDLSGCLKVRVELGEALGGRTQLSALRHENIVELLAFGKRHIPGLQKEKRVNEGIVQRKVIDLQPQQLQILKLQQTGRANKK
ncbi:hypothetical protein VB757_13365 [Synechococcus sp. BA-132 BA5]|nr:hypothetical protein [Synechococcus sp. BA-132 BA5]MEA5416115.1 hypothetical protein [Synechococcus sp. BA-132 BA5]